ncbi:hypothetical protein P22_3588 [Propionispora sp. 2/2-37]|uniref:ribosomal-processing cysteine protease Prp n=1 Tax=Propionispora sp. 2/2-37 TaxID=1677858 RepID=UPI0006BB6AB3|nr:ribosomal-processing cysteine protease Prp [Propionispora sp. 2/2-37]CUH97458.1 hypothetical protein P22_3588 [Propionispora sp. 2/2-37]
MITISPIVNTDRMIVGFSVTGHANAGPHGQDIVCAAVSVLAHTAVYGLERHLKREIKLDMAEGNMVFELMDPPDELTSVVLETTLLGFKEIASNYRKFVQIL